METNPTVTIWSIVSCPERKPANKDGAKDLSGQNISRILIAAQHTDTKCISYIHMA